jgi:hypothetical protein
LVAVLASLCLVAVSACASEESKTAELAYAKCGLPVYTELGDGEGQRVSRSQGQVEGLDGGRYRITGVATVMLDGDRAQTDYDYVCELAPDSSDERGFRVTSLQVKKAN